MAGLVKAAIPVEVVTVFTAGRPGPKPHQLAHFLNLPKRRREDCLATSSLGASYRHLAFREALLRAPGTPTINQALSSNSWDREVACMIASALPEPSARTLELWPAGTSLHVDHQIVATVGRCRSSSFRGLVRLGYYDDFPYFAGDSTADVSCEPPPDMPAFFRLRLTNAEANAKANALNCYSSQLSALFGGSIVQISDIPAHEAFWMSRED